MADGKKKMAFQWLHQKGEIYSSFWNLEWPCYFAWAVRMWRKQFHVNAKPVHFTHLHLLLEPYYHCKRKSRLACWRAKRCMGHGLSLNNYPPVHLAADHSNMDESSRDQTTQIDLAKTAVPRIQGQNKGHYFKPLKS